ncbi:MAG TPA: hypothetical protein VGG64_22000, partial [Pirellulales bacterium]
AKKVVPHRGLVQPTLAKSNMFNEVLVPTTPAAQFRPAMAAFESPDDTGRKMGRAATAAWN